MNPRSEIGRFGLIVRVGVQRFRGGLIVTAHRLDVSPNSRLKSNKEEGWWDLGLQRPSAPPEMSAAALPPVSLCLVFSV